MTGYTKLFGTIVASTIWREDKETKIVWITMLAMADKDGIVEGSIPGLADMARVTVSECQKALECLMSPDQFSRTKDHDGRRIEEVDGGWHLLNHAKYRAKMSADERREYFRIKKQEERASKKCQQMSNTVKDSQRHVPLVTHTEAEADTKAESIHGLLLPSKGEVLHPINVTLKEWLAYKKENGKSYKPRGWSHFLTANSKFHPSQVEAAILKSMAQGWSGIFPEKEKVIAHSVTPQVLTEEEAAKIADDEAKEAETHLEALRKKVLQPS